MLHAMFIEFVLYLLDSWVRARGRASKHRTFQFLPNEMMNRLTSYISTYINCIQERYETVRSCTYYLHYTSLYIYYTFSRNVLTNHRVPSVKKKRSETATIATVCYRVEKNRKCYRHEVFFFSFYLVTCTLSMKIILRHQISEHLIV